MKKIVFLLLTIFAYGCGDSDTEIEEAISNYADLQFRYYLDEGFDYSQPNLVGVTLFEDRLNKKYVVALFWIGSADKASFLQAIVGGKEVYAGIILSKAGTDDSGSANELVDRYTIQAIAEQMTFTQWKLLKGKEITFSILDQNRHPVGEPLTIRNYEMNELTKSSMIEFVRPYESGEESGSLHLPNAEPR